MNSLLLCSVGLAGMALGWLFYAKFLAEKLFKLNADFLTPAHELEDGVDYVVTNKVVLWGHHFTSVAGAAPIIGPAIAVIWGWGPAFLWVVIGTVFMAGCHDMAAIWASVRNRGKSMGWIAGNVVGRRARALLMVVIFLLLLMVNTAFGTVIARMMVAQPSAVLPVWGALLVAFLVGQAMYRFKLNLALVSLLGVIALYALIWAGPQMPLALPKELFGMPDVGVWVVLLFVYCGVASMLPVWMLLQPRDYINGLQLFVGLIALYLSFLIFHPNVVAPAFNHHLPSATPPLIPLLFVTIACGAISGFHGLVATGTTAKQIDKETDIRFVGYFGAMGEGMLALAAILAVTAGYASLSDWQGVYSAFGKGGVGAFIEGGGRILANGIGLDINIATTMLAVMAALFAGTTMDTGVRLQRYILEEFAELYRFPVLKNGYVATIFAVVVCMLLVFGTGGADGGGGLTIWPLFGTTNQLMAGLTLLVVSVMLLRRGVKSWYTLLPMAFLLVMTVIALALQVRTFYGKEEWVLLAMDIVILVSAVMISLECICVLRREWPKSDKAVQSSP